VKGYYSKIFAVLFLAAAMGFPALAQELEPGISRNPFEHPDLEKRRTSSVVALRGRSPGEIIRDEAAELELRATIRTGNGGWALANINGTMVEPGEEIEGFTLVWIGEEDVLLSKEGVEVILLMKTSDMVPTE
jgi:hypothetical protein